MTETKAEGKYLIQIILLSFSFFLSFHVAIQALRSSQGLKLFEQALDSGMVLLLASVPPPPQHLFGSYNVQGCGRGLDTEINKRFPSPFPLNLVPCGRPCPVIHRVEWIVSVYWIVGRGRQVGWHQTGCHSKWILGPCWSFRPVEELCSFWPKKQIMQFSA